MDLLTQGILGAAVAQVGFQRELGRRAIAYGAVIGMLPDLDVVTGFFNHPFSEIIHHRGFTHSLFFAPLFAPLLGYIFWRFYKRIDLLRSWMGLCFWALITHPLLDVFTIYGTQLLNPFSDFRFSIPAIPIIDPIYSLTLLSSVIAGVILKNRINVSQTIAAAALLLTTSYLFLGYAQNLKAEKICSQTLKDKDVKRIKAFTTLFQIYLRRVVVEYDTYYEVGYSSTWAPSPVSWQRFHKAVKIDDSNSYPLQIFNWFTDDWTFIEKEEEKLKLWDLRFGLWDLPDRAGLWYVEIDLKDNSVQGLKRPSLQPISVQRIFNLFKFTFKGPSI